MTDEFYVKDDSNTKCINCKKNSESTDTTIKTKVYHYIDENECIVDPGNGYYLIDSNTGTIGHCYERCLTCIKAEEYEKEGDLITNVIKTHNCDSCKSEYVQYGKECLNECPEKLVNVTRCKNPRCITSTERDLDQIFNLTNKEKQLYRCAYCEMSLEK